VIISAEEFCDAAQIDQETVSAFLVAQVVGAAQERIEAFANRNFESATRTEYHVVTDASTGHIYVNAPPISSVTLLQYDVQGTAQTVSSDDYIIDASVGKITLANDEHFFSRGEQSVLVTYVGGYLAAAMPNTVVLAVVLLAQHYWEVPEAMGRVNESVDGLSQTFEQYSDIPAHIRALVASYRRVSL